LSVPLLCLPTGPNICLYNKDEIITVAVHIQTIWTKGLAPHSQRVHFTGYSLAR